MTAVNYFKDGDEIRTGIIGIIDDELDFTDIQFLEDAINNIDYDFKDSVLYELHMDRYEIQSAPPCVERTFHAGRIIEKVYDVGSEKWITPIARG